MSDPSSPSTGVKRKADEMENHKETEQSVRKSSERKYGAFTSEDWLKNIYLVLKDNGMKKMSNAALKRALSEKFDVDMYSSMNKEYLSMHLKLFVDWKKLRKVKASYMWYEEEKEEEEKKEEEESDEEYVLPASAPSSYDGYDGKVVVDNDVDTIFTSLRGDMWINGKARDVVYLFGYTPSEYAKSFFDWSFVDSAGNPWTLYDWKMKYYMNEAEFLKMSDGVFFNIGGKPDADPTEFVEFLVKVVKPQSIKINGWTMPEEIKQLMN